MFLSISSNSDLCVDAVFVQKLSDSEQDQYYLTLVIKQKAHFMLVALIFYTKNYVMQCTGACGLGHSAWGTTVSPEPPALCLNHQTLYA